MPDYFLHPGTGLFQPNRRVPGAAATGPHARSGKEVHVTSDQLTQLTKAMDRARLLGDRLRRQAIWIRGIIFALSLLSLVVYVGVAQTQQDPSIGPHESELATSANDESERVSQKPDAEPPVTGNASQFSIKTELVAVAGRISLAQVSSVAPLVFAFFLLFWARITASRATVEAEIMLTDSILRRFGVPTPEMLADNFRKYWNGPAGSSGQAGTSGQIGTPVQVNPIKAAKEYLVDKLARMAHRIVHYCFDVLVFAVGFLSTGSVAWSAKQQYVAVFRSNRFLGVLLFAVLAACVLLPIVSLLAVSAAKKKKKDLVRKYLDSISPSEFDVLCRCGRAQH